MKFEKIIVKAFILVLVISAFLVAKPNFAALEDYNITTAVAEGWQAGSSEYWHFIPSNERSEFYLGEKVHFFAQCNYINVPHTWSMKVYLGEELHREISTFYEPGEYGWHFSNYNPWLDDLVAGNYRVDYFLDTGNGEQFINSKNFSVLNELPDDVEPFVFHHAETASSWSHGNDSEYWNLKSVGKSNRFNAGKDVQLMVQIRDIYFNHRYMIELQKDGITQWDYTSGWMDVERKWDYGNFFPSYEDAQPGNYEFKVSIDIGTGFNYLATIPFVVDGEQKKYSYHHTNLATAWEHGEGGMHWDLKPLGQKNVFQRGETIYALSQIRNIYYSHQWKVELYRGEEKMWEYEDEWREVGSSGWAYGNFFPAYFDAQPGEYTYKLYINTGEGYVFLDSKEFSVEGEVEAPVFYSAITAAGWKHGEEDNQHWNLKPVQEKSVFEDGESVYLMTQVRNIYVDHRYRVELYKDGEPQWDYDTNWQNVGAGWKYSNFFPVYHNAQFGSYEFWYYLDAGDGFELHGKKAFEVISNLEDPIVEDPIVYEDYNRGVTIYNTVDKNDFKYFSENGVSTVRLMLMDGDLLIPSVDYDLTNPQNEILPENINKLNSVLALGAEYEIKVIVDVHEMPGLNRWFISEDKPLDTRLWGDENEADQYQDLLVTIWDQLSEELKDESGDAVIYELFNEAEPKTESLICEDRGILWENLQDRIINTIRENGDSHLVVASPAYSWQTESLAGWVPSETILNDENLIVSVHGYRPIKFTIQEEAWYGNVDYNAYPGTYNEEHYGETTWNYDAIDNLFANTVGDFYDKYGIQVYIAEFAVNREAPGAELWLLDMMNLMNKEYSDEIWGWSVHVWEEDQYARLNHLDYSWGRAGMNDFSADPEQLEAVLAGINNIEETLME